MSSLLLLCSIVVALVCQSCYAQNELPDSIPENFGMNCPMQQATLPTICCVETEGFATFCSIQCVLPPPNQCVCIDSFTGMRIAGFELFPEPNTEDPSAIDCIDVFPPTIPPPVTEAPTTPPPAPTTPPPAPTTPPPAPTTPPPAPTTPPPAPTTPPPAPTTPPPAPTTPPPAPTTPPPAPTTTMATPSPTTEEPDEEDTSRSSGTSGTSRSRTTGSRTTGSRGTSRTSRTQTGTGSRSRSTGRTATSQSSGTSGTSRSRTTGSRTTGSRGTSGTSRTQTGTGSRSRSTGHTATSQSSGTSGTSRSRTTGSRTTGSRGTSGTSRTQTGTGSRSRTSESRSTMSRLSRGSRMCPRVDEITSEGCSPACVVQDRYGCPSCDETCQREDDICSGCTDSQVCVRMGRFGTPVCVERPGLGERCDGGSDEEEEEEEEDESSDTSRSRSESTGTKRRKSRVRGAIKGARERLAFGRLDQVEVECRDELVCVEMEDEDRSVCQEENPNGPCVMARAESPSLSCTPEGDFEPLQCDALQCQCVEPSDGTPVPGTQVTVDDPSNLPDCDEEVFESCVSEFGRTRLGVPHGEYAVDAANCRRCLCNDGTLEECEPTQTCQSIQANPISCEFDGETVTHGEQFDVDCNKCGCYNGIIRCTRRKCELSTIEDRCATCDSEAFSQVCGLNGVTYPSSCHAVFCSRQIPFTLTEGACNTMDVCSRFPCEEGETCIKSGGTACVGSCEAEDLRICVNLDELVCEDVPAVPEDSQTNSRALCATNGVTYPSLCHLIQDTGNEGVAYAGACNSEECSGGSVCGTDGITYENVCVLRSTAANTRVDYVGDCVSGDESVEATCESVRQANRCAHNPDNCRFLVNAVEGCCPICGGLVTVALELRGMTEYVKINPEVRVLDTVYAFLIESEIIPDEVVLRCEIEFSTYSNLEIALLARTSDDQEFCNDISVKIAEFIDNPQELTTYVPESFQFATAAVGGPPVLESGSIQGTTVSVALLIFTTLIASSLL